MEITSDQSISDIVRHGLRVTFLNTPDLKYLNEPSFSRQEKDIDSEVCKLQRKKVIIPTSINDEDFISTIFTGHGSHRVILNLKKVNIFVESPHFKMDSIKDIISMVHRGAWMASVDLKDAFFSISINEKH